jgi:CubicO group peptidase (beta-lactamase class C family)
MSSSSHSQLIRATVSRRRLLSRLAAATSVALVAPVLSTRYPTLAQTPVATPGSTLPSTLAADASTEFRAVAEALQAAMAATGTPGAALGILAGGREEYASFGVTSIETGEPVMAATLFQIGSITKPFTGTAVMRLVEDGTLDLETTVRTYLPEFQLQDEAVAEQVTVRHLLTHTGGWWGDLFADTGSGDDAIERYVSEWFPELPQFSPLGEYFSYNNAGFNLLGRILEVVTGQEYRAAIHELVLAPLGMSNSFFAPDEVLARPHAQGHFSEEGEAPRVQEPLFIPRSSDPAGGLWSTTADLLRFARFHLGDGTVDGERILSAASLAMMQTPQQPILGDPTSAMGLPWFIIDLQGERLVTHDGGTFGQGAQLLLAPDRDFAVAMFGNALPAAALAAQEALATVFNQYFEIDLSAAQASAAMATPMASPVASPPAVVSAVDLDQYAGQYATPDATYDLNVVDGGLVLSYELHPHPAQVQPKFVADVPPETPVELLAPDLALVTIAGLPMPLIFVRNDNGEVGWVSAGLRLVPKVEGS